MVAPLVATESLNEPFGQKDVPHHKTTAGSTWDFSTWSMEVTALASSFHFSRPLLWAKKAGADSLCPKVVNSSSRGGFDAEMILNFE